MGSNTNNVDNPYTLENDDLQEISNQLESIYNKLDQILQELRK